MNGYLKMINGAPTMVTPNGYIILEFNPPPKYLEHLVDVDFETREVRYVQRSF